MEDRINYKKVLLIVFVFALIIRVIWGILIFEKEGTNNFADDWEYINFAKNILENGIFAPFENSIVGPGFPLIIASLFMFFGDNLVSIILLNALISAFLCVLIFYIGRELFNERVAMFASVWSIFYILFIKYTSRILKENWLILIFPLIILLFIRETKRDKISFYFLLLLAFLFSFLIHMDERFFTYFPFLCIGFIFLDQDTWKKGLKKGVAFFLLVVILMVPWLIRNFNVYNRVVILAVRTAKFTDRILGYDYEGKKLKDEKKRDLELWEKATKLLLEGKEVTFHVKHLKGLKRAIKLGYVPYKFSLIERWIAEFKELWRPILLKGGFIGDGYRFKGPSWSLKHNLSVGLSYGVLLPFFIIGILFILKNKNKYCIFILLIIVIHTCIHVVVAFARNRYRIPIDAFIIIIAFYGLQQLYLKFKDWKMNKKNLVF
jgi:4-amino-4-deoxy-L-arabinose transferase-like glycosyltransferase